MGENAGRAVTPGGEARVTPSGRAGRPVRWWPAVAVLALALAALVWNWGFSEGIRQQRVVLTFPILFFTVFLLLVWFLFFSRFKARIRLWGLAAVALVGAFFFFAVRISGVTGDLVPILSWRWSHGLEEAPAAEASAATTEGRAYPQFLGPKRDATLTGVGLARDWRERPPVEVWRRPVGEGWSSFAIVGDLAITQEQRGPEELVVAYRLATGEVVWSHADEARYETTIAGIGPRATPTVAGGRVFTFGATGILNALDLATGERLWSHDLVDELGAGIPEWGKSCSPLVVDGRVVVSAGAREASLVAYDAETGELAWKGGSDRSGYSSPVLATLAGVPQIVIFNQASVAAHDPATGEPLWEFAWPKEQPNVAQPLPLPGDRLLVSSGYGIGAKMLEIERGADGGLAAKLLWESPRLKAKFAHYVERGGYVYGLDDGVLVCLDPATGERCWKSGRYGHGQVLLVDDLLLVQAEDGSVVLVEPDPSEHRELGRFSAFERKTWNNPALAGPYLLLRNDREAALYELPLAG